MNIQHNTIIGELVAQDYRTASVFRKYGIDFCCQGNRTIADACLAKNIETDLVTSDLKSIDLFTGGTTDFQAMPLDDLADYIENTHHRYVQEKSQEILPYLDKICRVHGGRHPELEEISAQFNAVAAELAMHMKKEELMLFPHIRKLARSHREGTAVTATHFSTVANPIAMMMHEHSAEGDRFSKIAGLSNNYTPPEDACNTYRVTFALLQEFEQDLHLHIHLENNILFPKAIGLEKEMQREAGEIAQL